MTATPEAAPATILLVDDAIDTLRMLTAALEADGMTVLVATDGASALAVTEHARPDLILMDA
ncbi:MAG: response regulator, partial [Thermaurantiacus tibetensis]